jgi:predicted DNA-binding transcriptional regulator YafY
MRRADRLFQLVQLIRGRRLTKTSLLADRLQVSLRTVYRDVADLQQQGVPIEGEAGVGYRMRAGFDLPPLMFTQPEAQALVAAIRMAQPRLDAGLARAAEAALSKILAVLAGQHPSRRREPGCLRPGPGPGRRGPCPPGADPASH